jgi:AcrR family transcriptional regulator
MTGDRGVYNVHIRVYVVHMTTAQTADRLLAVTRKIMIAEGAAAVTMRRVAADAGVTTMASYRHFPNRDALLSAVAEECAAELGRDWAASSAIADPQQRILALLDDLLDFALGTPHLYAFLMIDRRQQARRYPQDFDDGASPAFSRLTDAVEHGMRQKALLTDDVIETSLTLTATVQGLIQLYLRDRIAMSPPQFRDLCHRSVRRVLHGLTP